MLAERDSSHPLNGEVAERPAIATDPADLDRRIFEDAHTALLQEISRLKGWEPNQVIHDSASLILGDYAIDVERSGEASRIKVAPTDKSRVSVFESSVGMTRPSARSMTLRTPGEVHDADIRNATQRLGIKVETGRLPTDSCTIMVREELTGHHFEGTVKGSGFRAITRPMEGGFSPREQRLVGQIQGAFESFTVPLMTSLRSAASLPIPPS